MPQTFGSHALPARLSPLSDLACLLTRLLAATAGRHPEASRRSVAASSDLRGCRAR
jgi:hypothetical protein